MFQAPPAGASTSRCQVSDIEAEEGDIAILHHVVAPFEPHLSSFPSRGIGSRRHQVVVGDDLRLDKPTLDIAMDHAGGLGRLRALANRPGPDLWIARREEGDEVQQAIGRVDEGRQGCLLQACVFEEDRGLVVRQFADLRLEARGERDDLGVLGGGFVTEGLQLGGLLADDFSALIDLRAGPGLGICLRTEDGTMPRDIPVGNGRLLVTFDNRYQIRVVYFTPVGQANHDPGHGVPFLKARPAYHRASRSDQKSDGHRKRGRPPDGVVARVIWKTIAAFFRDDFPRVAHPSRG